MMIGFRQFIQQISTQWILLRIKISRIQNFLKSRFREENKLKKIENNNIFI